MAGDSITVGNCEVISVHDLDLNFPSAMVFPSIPAAEFDEFRGQYPACFGKIGLAADCGGYVVRSGGKTIIVDTGFGPGPIAMLGGLKGNMVGDMKTKGISPEDVDMVVHTHLHVDHVGWNMTEGRATFPNARYYAPEKDFETFSQDMATNPHMEQVVPLKALGKLELYHGEVALTPEVTTMPTPGHTPDHHSVLINSGGEKLLVMGDIAHHPAQVDRCDWSPSFDYDGAAAAKTREKLMKQLESNGDLTAFGHFPNSGFGRIKRSNGRRVFEAVE